MRFRRKVYVAARLYTQLCCTDVVLASADRRPVDPPPIVELRIYECDNGVKKDITFALNGNYFLFATLEQARQIAHGRVPQDPQRAAPVLTGTPVAGMVYLDRPQPAGYFIFPDLSVRHEGKYRLAFSLYEELKEEKDEDPMENESDTAPGNDAHVTHRLEVRSQPFTVFSAKKFPGLATSTNLSRTVAEQGCRVRIRRDVRMRRREKGGDKNWDDYEDETAYARERQGATPDMYPPGLSSHEVVPRPRSASVSSHVSLAPAPQPESRRASLHQDMPPAAFQPPMYGAGQPSAPPTTQNAYASQSPYVTSTAQQFPAQQTMQQQSAMQPPQMPYQYQQYNYSTQTQPMAQPYYNYAPAPQQAPVTQQYDAQAHMRSGSIDYSQQIAQDPRRASMAVTQAPSYSYNTQTPSMTSMNTAYGQTNGYTQQAMSQMRSGSTSTASSGSHMPAAPLSLPPINTSLQLPRDKPLEASSPTSAATGNYYDMSKSMSSAPAVQTPVEAQTGKRSYGNVFPTQHMNGPLRQGARPNDSYAASTALYAEDGDEDDFAEMAKLRMSYRRADGREIARPLPPSN